MATKNKQPSRYTIDIDPEIRAKLKALADKNEVTLAVIVRWALRDYLFLHSCSVDSTVPQNEQALFQAAQPG